MSTSIIGHSCDPEGRVTATYGRVTPHIGIQVLLAAMHRVEARKAQDDWPKAKFRHDAYLAGFEG